MKRAKFTLLVSLLFLFCCSQLRAAVGGPDNYGYIWIDSLPMNWVDITQTGTQLSFPGGSLSNIQMNWNFDYYGSNVNSFRIFPHSGHISFNPQGGGSPCFDPIPTVGGSGNNFILPLGAGFYADSTQTSNPAEIYYYDNGVDVLIISFINMPFRDSTGFGFTGSATFQMILSGADNSITLQYDSLDFGTAFNNPFCPRDLLIGIESPGGVDGLTYLEDMLPAQQSRVVFTTDQTLVNRVTGTVFWDFNGNGIQDTNDLPAGNVPVTIQQTGNINYSSVANGDYTLGTQTGAYTVSLASLPNYATGVTPQLYNGAFSTLGNTDSLRNFALQTVGGGVLDLCVSLTAMGRPAPGRLHYLILTGQNVGLIPMVDTLKLELDSQVTLVNSAPMPDSAIGNLLIWYGVNLAPGQSRTIGLTIETDSTAQSGDTVSFFASICPSSGDADSENNQVQLTDTASTSYDPNDKLVEPVLGLFPYQAANREPLTYTIRFQNTGSIAAYRVILRDTLDAQLDVSTLRMIDASHTYQLNVSGNRAVWTFEPINLPDSAADLAGSQGFVKFQIQPVAGLQQGDEIRNRAAIYFDYNAPVITNWAVTPVDTNLGTSLEPLSPTTGLRLWPQPAENYFWFETEGLAKQGHQVSLFDLQGRLIPIRIEEFQGNRIKISYPDLPGGLYFLRVKGPGMSGSSQKVWVR